MTAAGVAACPLFYAAIVDTYDINAQSTHTDRIKAKATTFCSEYSKTACTSVQSKDEEGNLVMSSTGAYGRYLAACCVETVETSMVLSGATVVSASDMRKALAKQLGVDSSAVEVVLSSLVSETSLTITGTLSDYTGSTTAHKARKYAFENATAWAAGVAYSAVSQPVTYATPSAGRRQLGELVDMDVELGMVALADWPKGMQARRLRRASIAASLKITSTTDISSALSASALQAAFVTKHALAVTALATDPTYSSVASSVSAISSATAAVPSFKSTYTTKISAVGQTAASLSTKMSSSSFVANTLSGSSITGISGTATTPVTKAKPTVAVTGTAAPTEASGSATIIIVVVCVVVVAAVIGVVVFMQSKGRAQVSSKPKQGEQNPVP